MSTIKEVAHLAKVSTATVSHVINESANVSSELRERVQKAIQALDYRPNHVARSLKMRRTNMLGMVVTDITDPFFAQMIRGAEDAAREHGYLLTIFNTDDNVEKEKEVFAVLRSRRMDGILLVSAPSKGSPKHLQQTITDQVPVVCLARIPKGFPVDSVTIRNRENARECVAHLISMGHTRIAAIGGPDSVAPARDRSQGYLDALQEAGLPVDSALMAEGDFRSESGYRLGKKLLQLPYPPTALFVVNGMMTVGLLKALDELGLRSPDDVALAAFGDRGVAEYLYPNVTVAAQPSYEIGYRGAELVIQRIRGEQKPSRPLHIQLDAPLELKKSSLQAPAKKTTK
jgi:LacI family transcriptional regulator, galactose operon repressor